MLKGPDLMGGRAKILRLRSLALPGLFPCSTPKRVRLILRSVLVCPRFSPRHALQPVLERRVDPNPADCTWCVVRSPNKGSSTLSTVPEYKLDHGKPSQRTE